MGVSKGVRLCTLLSCKFGIHVVHHFVMIRNIDSSSYGPLLERGSKMMQAEGFGPRNCMAKPHLDPLDALLAARLSHYEVYANLAGKSTVKF